MGSTLEHLCIIICLFVSAALSRPIPFKQPSSLSIATYNTYWLFNPSKLSESHPACPWKDEYSAHRHIEDVASVIHSVNADIWILQEVQDHCTLQLLNKRLGGEYMAFLEEGADRKFGMNVAILSKYQPTSKPFRLNGKYITADERVVQLSKNIVATFSIPPLNFSLIGVHLKMPRRGVRGADRQKMEIDLLMEEARMVLKGGSEVGVETLIIAGDCNDVDMMDHPTLNPKKHSKRVHTNNSLPQLKKELQLHNCLSFVDPMERFTTSDHIAIDHILLSTTLVPRLNQVTAYNHQAFFATSDHCPLKVDIHLKE